MSGRDRSRREFLLKSLSGVGAAWAVANYAGIEEAYAFVQQSAKSGTPALAFFTAAQAAEVEAMAAQIIPIKVLTAMEKTPFFNLVRTHTITGFFASPALGGNAGKVGWKLVNYDDSLNHKPPFGYYDALPGSTSR